MVVLLTLAVSMGIEPQGMICASCQSASEGKLLHGPCRRVRILRLPSHQLTWKCTDCRKTTFLWEGAVFCASISVGGYSTGCTSHASKLLAESPRREPRFAGTTSSGRSAHGHSQHRCLSIGLAVSPPEQTLLELENKYHSATELQTSHPWQTPRKMPLLVAARNQTTQKGEPKKDCPERGALLRECCKGRLLFSFSFFMVWGCGLTSAG